MQEREKLLVWVYTLKQLNKLKSYGLIHYISKKMNYVIMYVDKEKAEDTISKLEALHFVRDVEKSPFETVSFDFDKTLGHVVDSQRKREESAEKDINYN